MTNAVGDPKPVFFFNEQKRLLKNFEVHHVTFIIHINHIIPYARS